MSANDDKPLTPNVVLALRKERLGDEIRKLKERVKLTLINNYDGRSSVSVSIEGFDWMVVDAVVEFYGCGEDDDKWHIERNDDSLVFSKYSRS